MQVCGGELEFVGFEVGLDLRDDAGKGGHGHAGAGDDVIGRVKKFERHRAVFTASACDGSGTIGTPSSG